MPHRRIGPCVKPRCRHGLDPIRGPRHGLRHRLQPGYRRATRSVRPSSINSINSPRAAEAARSGSLCPKLRALVAVGMSPCLCNKNRIGAVPDELSKIFESTGKSGKVANRLHRRGEMKKAQEQGLRRSTPQPAARRVAARRNARRATFFGPRDRSPPASLAGLLRRPRRPAALPDSVTGRLASARADPASLVQLARLDPRSAGGCFCCLAGGRARSRSIYQAHHSARDLFVFRRAVSCGAPVDL